MDIKDKSQDVVYPAIREPMTSEEMRFALGKEGEWITKWFIRQERTLWGDKVAAECQDLVDKLLTHAGAATNLTVDKIHEVLTFLLVEYHHTNIIMHQDQILQKYRHVVEEVKRIRDERKKIKPT